MKRLLMVVAFLVWTLVPQASWASAGPGWPLAEPAESILEFGAVYCGDGGSSVTHRGVDLLAPEGAQIYAAHGGTVTFAGSVPAGEGLTMIAVTIESEGFRLSYMPLYDRVVSAGDTVAPGELLGSLAASGDRSSGQTHLHVGARVGDLYVDPMSYLTPPAPGPVLPDADPLPDTAPLPDTVPGEVLPEMPAAPSEPLPVSPPVPAPSPAPVPSPAPSVLPSIEPVSPVAAAASTIPQPAPAPFVSRTQSLQIERAPEIAPYPVAARVAPSAGLAPARGVGSIAGSLVVLGGLPDTQMPYAEASPFVPVEGTRPTGAHSSGALLLPAPMAAANGQAVVPGPGPVVTSLAGSPPTRFALGTLLTRGFWGALATALGAGLLWPVWRSAPIRSTQEPFAQDVAAVVVR